MEGGTVGGREPGREGAREGGRRECVCLREGELNTQ